FEIGEENITFDDIIRAANKGDGLAELILERTGMFLGTAIASVINLLNIEKVVVGGALMKAGELVLNAIRERASVLTFEPAFTAVTIEKGLLGENACTVGAGLLALNRSE
ncbi:MAG: ROK family protein, partial [Acidobacteriota bacterium]|nr:ROK family protein [Acidobacteriota bacterium]